LFKRKEKFPVSRGYNTRFHRYSYLANQIARGLKKTGVPFQINELIQWGKIGLWDACRRYSGSEEEFAFYAKFRIRGQIIDEIRKESGYIRRIGSDNQPEYRAVLENDIVDQTLNEDRLSSRQLLMKVLISMAGLTKREENILLKYYFEGLTQKELAAQLSISEPRVCQIKTKAVERLLEMTGINLSDL
jgi:RNA polymerase sigma factor for flagellar operon FliA